METGSLARTACHSPGLRSHCSKVGHSPPPSGTWAACASQCAKEETPWGPGTRPPQVVPAGKLGHGPGGTGGARCAVPGPLLGPGAPLESGQKETALGLCPSRGTSLFVQNPRLSGRKERGKRRRGANPELRGPECSRGWGAVTAPPSCCLRARGQGQGLHLRCARCSPSNRARRCQATPQLTAARPPAAGGMETTPPCAGVHGGHTGGSQPWGWSAPCGVAQGLGSTCVHLWPGAGRRKQHILPGGIEAVVRADRVVPEELLAAVRTGVCTGREEKHHSEKSPPRRRDHAGPAGPLVHPTDEA